MIRAGDEKQRAENILIQVGKLKKQKHEVTVAEYALCVKAGDCKTPGGFGNWGKADRAKHPVNVVSWHDAVAYCKWTGLRLPTEKEWEYAAKSGGKRGKRYPWGNAKPSCDYAVYDSGGRGCGKGTTWPVCSKPKGNTEQGLCDMAGNIYEWTNSWYDKDKDKDDRVIRGGSFYNSANTLRSSGRDGYVSPSHRNDLYGFRCAH